MEKQEVKDDFLCQCITIVWLYKDSLQIIKFKIYENRQMDFQRIMKRGPVLTISLRRVIGIKVILSCRQWIRQNDCPYERDSFIFSSDDCHALEAHYTFGFIHFVYPSCLSIVQVYEQKAIVKRWL